LSFARIVWVVLDSVGIGEMPDAAEYGDSGSDTLGNIASQRRLYLPTLCCLGLGNIQGVTGLVPEPGPIGCYGRCALASPGKDTTIGHWEMAGIRLEHPFPIFPEGFPPEVMEEFERRAGRPTLGNKAASGTEIIQELGAEHLRTGAPIVYTSADSVFQIAAHEEVIPVEELYRMCRAAREILTGPFEAGRVIARPFVGKPGAFSRTGNRRDFAVAPPEGMLLDRLSESGVPVAAIGKVAEVFLGRGIREDHPAKSNAEAMAKILDVLAQQPEGLIWANLIDFDMLYGHRNDVEGYAKALEEVDAWLPQLLERLGQDDLLILTADHGCDPTTPSTDHSREYVPLITLGPGARRGVDLGTRDSLADIGQTVAENFGTTIATGLSFLDQIGENPGAPPGGLPTLPVV
jgi:phosphopentomutase